MTISGDGGILTAGPVCRPRRHRLATAAVVLPQADNEWAKGSEWDQLPCRVDVGVTGMQCPPLPEQHVKAATEEDRETLVSGPYTVYAGWKCSTGGTPAEDAWSVADRLLEENWWRGVERAFWHGIDQDGLPITSSLGTALPDDLTPAGGAANITHGVSLLEAFAADCMDCEPVIHAGVALATYVAERGLLERDGDNLRLKGTGTLFVPGAGYGTNGFATFDEEGDPQWTPGAAAPAGEAWMAVTGVPTIVHGPRFFTPPEGDLAGAVDRALNDIAVFAERIVMFQLGCCAGATRVDLSACCGGGVDGGTP